MRSDTKRVIKQFEINTLGRIKGIERTEKMLAPDESVLYCVPTNLDTRVNATGEKEELTGTLMLTNKRVIYRSNVLGLEKVEIIPLDQISSITSSSKVLSGNLQIITVAKEYDFLIPARKKSPLKDVRETFERATRYYTQTPVPPEVQVYASDPPSATQPTEVDSEGTADSSITEQIEELATLRDRGLLTEEEFSTKKKQLLGL